MQTHVYHICKETFPLEDQSKRIRTVRHAFDQWEVMTNELIKTTHDPGDCADYSYYIATSTAAFVGLELPSNEEEYQVIQGLLDSLLNQFYNNGIQDIHNTNAKQNEVRIYDDEDENNIELEDIGVFPRLGKDVAINPCVLRDGGARACAQLASDPDEPPYRVITDIIIKLSEFDVKFTELPGGDDIVDRSDADFSTCHGAYLGYKLLMHEVGHALGIRGSVKDANLEILDDQEKHHPSLSQVVMIGQRTYYCSPTPFDLMAIHALYQTTR